MASIPSPTQAVWHLGPLPVRAYALCIVAGIFVCVALTLRRWRARGGRDEDIWDVAFWAIIFGIIGGRLYHVITDAEKYFGSGRHPIDALKIWDGGLGIWGAVALGVLGAWIGCRRKGIRLTAFADAAAPGLAFAQGIGRWGNWFNNELFGGPTSVPWKLQIHCFDTVAGHAVDCGTGTHRPGVLPADVPVRVDLGHRVGVRADLGGSPVDTRSRKRIRPLRDGLCGRAGVDRGAAIGLRPRVPRRASERLDGHRGVPRGARLVHSPPGSARRVRSTPARATEKPAPVRGKPPGARASLPPGARASRPPVITSPDQ